MLGTNTGFCDRRDLTVGTIFILPTYGKSEPRCMSFYLF